MVKPSNLKRTISPTFDLIPDASFSFHGHLGERIQKNIDNWLLPMLEANPGILEMFRDKDRQPRRYIMPWAGEFPGKYLTSAVLTLRLTQDERLLNTLQAFVKDLINLQDEDGYLGPHPRHVRFWGTGMWNDRELWDVWGHYHCILGLLLWYEETGDESALRACHKAADLICKEFMEAGRPLSGQIAQEMDMAISHAYALLYEITDEERYLRMLHYIEQDWQAPKAGDYVRNALAGKALFEMPRHRWESLHDIQAIAELYLITGDDAYRSAFKQIWWSIVANDRHNTGAFSTDEGAVGNPYQSGPIETCCTVAWIAASIDMLRLTGDSRVADEIEFSTLNAMLGAQHPSGRWWTYDTPSDGIRLASAHQIVFHSAPGTPELNCCAVNGPRALGMLSQWAVMQAEDGLVVNYFGPGKIKSALPSGKEFQLAQKIDYPASGEVELELQLQSEERFCLYLRVPGWSINSAIQVNGEMVGDVKPGNYLILERRWRKHNVIHISLDMSPHFWIGEREMAGKASIYRGPILLAYDRRYNQIDPDQVPPIDLQRLDLKPIQREGRLKPWMAFQADFGQKTGLYLCDFASAGTTATPYKSWLPIEALDTSAIIPDQFHWHTRFN